MKFIFCEKITKMFYEYNKEDFGVLKTQVEEKPLYIINKDDMKKHKLFEKIASYSDYKDIKEPNKCYQYCVKTMTEEEVIAYNTNQILEGKNGILMEAPLTQIVSFVEAEYKRRNEKERTF